MSKEKKVDTGIGTFSMCTYEYRDYTLHHLFSGWYELFAESIKYPDKSKAYNAAEIRVGTTFAKYAIGVIKTTYSLWYNKYDIPYMATYKIMPYPKISDLLNAKFGTCYSDKQIFTAFSGGVFAPTPSYTLKEQFDYHLDERPKKYCYPLSGDIPDILELKRLGIELMQYSNAFKYKSPEKAKYYNGGNVTFDMKLIQGMINELIGEGQFAYELIYDNMEDILAKTAKDKFNTYC